MVVTYQYAQFMLILMNLMQTLRALVSHTQHKSIVHMVPSSTSHHVLTVIYVKQTQVCKHKHLSSPDRKGSYRKVSIVRACVRASTIYFSFTIAVSFFLNLITDLVSLLNHSSFLELTLSCHAFQRYGY
jgi:hypothetical protein